MLLKIFKATKWQQISWSHPQPGRLTKVHVQSIVIILLPTVKDIIISETGEERINFNLFISFGKTQELCLKSIAM